MNLDTGVGIDLRIRIAANMGPSFDDGDPQSPPLGALLGNGQTEESRSNDNQIKSHFSPSPAQKHIASFGNVCVGSSPRRHLLERA